MLDKEFLLIIFVYFPCMILVWGSAAAVLTLAMYYVIERWF